MRGNKPGTLTRLQKQQKQASREKVIAAAIELFGRHSFVGTSIDDIVRHAGVSRVTFYRHFTSKLDVASSILEYYTELLIDDYSSLAAQPEPTRRDITNWIRRILDLWRQSPRNMAMLASLLHQDPALISHRQRTYERTVARLGESIAAFRRAATERGGEAHIRAHLLLTELENLCYELTISGWDVDEEVAIRVVAERFRQFIAAG